MGLVIAHHKKTNPKVGEVFVDEAMYVRTTEKVVWKIGIRLKAHETGHMYYTVSPEGEVKISTVVKDG